MGSNCFSKLRQSETLLKTLPDQLSFLFFSFWNFNFSFFSSSSYCLYFEMRISFEDMPKEKLRIMFVTFQLVAQCYFPTFLYILKHYYWGDMMCKHTPCLQLLEVQGNGLTWDDDLMECLARLSRTLGISTLSKQAFRDSNATCFYEEQLWWRVQQIHENILSSLCQCVCLYWTNCLVQLKKSMQEFIRIKSNPQQQLRIKDCLISACSP